jgi:DNA-binding NtrC family response regulator
MRQLSRLPWPGNVSQLRRVLTETVARQRSGMINADKLPQRRQQTRSGTRSGNVTDPIYRKMNDYGIA